MTFAESEIRRLLERGTYPGELFYRLKATGNGETKWVNVSPAKLERIAQIFGEDD